MTVTIDDETAATVLLSRSEAVALREGGTATYTVRLGAPPTMGNAQVQASSNDAAVEVSKAGETAGATQNLTFSATDWATARR